MSDHPRAEEPAAFTEEEVAELRAKNEVLRRELTRLREEHREAMATALEETRLDMVTFFGLVAHQLKNPLLPLDVSLLTLARALERGASVPEDVLPRMLRQTRRLARLIDALLVDLPRIEDGSLRVAVTSFDLREPVSRAVKEAVLMLEARTFSFEAPESEVMVLGDPERVEQIVCSLIDNAVKYSPPEQPIEVRMSRDGSFATVTVEDRGIGIPAREIGQVFTKFYRGSNAPSYLYRGLGVGLYLARHLAELCRGKLSIESAEGSGTSCCLHVPVDEPRR